MRFLIGTVAALLLLAGCLDPAATDDIATDPAHIDGDPFGEPIVDTGAVRTERTVSGWEARQTITYENGVDDAVRAGVLLGIGAGSIAVRPAESGSYFLELELVAQAADEDTAREALESMEVRHEDGLQDNDLVVSLTVETPPFTDPGGLPLVGQNVQRASHIVADLPAHLAYGLTAGAGSGDIAIDALAGRMLEADTGSGDIGVDGAAFDRIALDAGSGDITVLDATAASLSVDTGSGEHMVSGTFDAIQAGSGSGDQSYQVAAQDSGRYEFDAGSGSITVALVRGASQAYDAMADNGSGSIDIDITDGEPVGEQDDDHAHVRSTGFEDASIQTTITAEAGSGDIEIAD